MKTTPTQFSERIVSLDVLRGIAVLGILIMNIQSFSMIMSAYLNPLSYGNLEGVNKLIWGASHLFADLKFMTLFSILFGAGIILFTDRLKEKGIHSLSIHYRRTFWLLIFGLCHAYLLWYGDILVAYAISGFWVVLLRNIKARKLLIIGLSLFSVAILLYLLTGFSIPFMGDTDKQGLLEGWMPGAELISRELEAYRGSWIQQMEYRIKEAIMMQSTAFFIQTGWRVSGLMLIGMALFKWGILSAQKSKAFYIKLILLSLIPGILLVAYGMKTNFNVGFSMEYSFFLGSQYNYVGSFLMSLGYIGIVMLCIKSGSMTRFKNSLQAVGQMALSNYLLQTIICTSIFYGHGFAMFGKLDRWEQIIIVLAIWVFQMIASTIWMKHYRFGPFEWLWRSLTYRQFQPMRK